MKHPASLHTAAELDRMERQCAERAEAVVWFFLGCMLAVVGFALILIGVFF